MCYRTLYIGTGEPAGRGAASLQPYTLTSLPSEARKGREKPSPGLTGLTQWMSPPEGLRQETVSCLSSLARALLLLCPVWYQER